MPAFGEACSKESIPVSATQAAAAPGRGSKSLAAASLPPGKPENGVTPAAQVELSAAAQALQAAKAEASRFVPAVEAAPDTREALVTDLKARVEAGTYNVSGADIAEQMVRHEERLITGGKEPSMLVDVRHERAVEVEAILGNVVRMAKAKKVEVPLLSMLHVLTKARNFSICKPNEWKTIARVD